MNNICAVTSNVHRPYLVNGRAIKSINQKYNKQIAGLQSETKKSQNKFKSKELNRLYSKRGDKLSNEIHKITDFIVKSILMNKIDYVVIGYNKEWKQNINLGKRTNQNFVQIPFSKILNHLTYKLQLNGIEVHLQEESYTSKCSYFDNEAIKKHMTYKGNRTKRGLFITSRGIKINADVNGSLNIHRKFILKAANDVLFEPVGVGLVMNPIKINLRTNFSLEKIYSLISSL
jgi:putative transposase